MKRCTAITEQRYRCMLKAEHKGFHEAHYYWLATIPKRLTAKRFKKLITSSIYGSDDTLDPPNVEERI